MYTITASDLLFSSIDALILLLLLSPNQHIVKESRIALKACLYDMDKVHFLRVYHLPLESSPIILTYQSFKETTQFNFEYYDQYPQPWYAMMYDLSKYMASIN